MKYFFSIILLILFNINSSFSQNSLGSIIENTNLALPSSYNFVEYVFPEPNDEVSCSGLINTTASIDKIFFSQTHRMSIDHPFYFLIGHRPALFQLAITGSGSSPDVKVEGFMDGVSLGEKCLKGPPNLSSNINTDIPNFDDYFSVTLPKSWMKIGLTLRVKIGSLTRDISESELKMGPYTEMNLVQYDLDVLDYNTDDPYETIIDNFVQEVASAFPASVIRFGKFPETIKFPEIIASNGTEQLVRLTKKSDKAPNGINSDGSINSIALQFLNGIQKSTGDYLSTFYFGNTLNLRPGGWGGIKNFVSFDYHDIFIHELGHGFGLPHWGDWYQQENPNVWQFSYPYGGDPVNYNGSDGNGGGRGTSWNFIQDTYEFIDPICKYDGRGVSGTETSDAMQRNNFCLEKRTNGPGPWDGFGDFSALAMHRFLVGHSQVYNGKINYRNENKDFQFKVVSGYPTMSLDNDKRVYHRDNFQQQEFSLIPYEEKYPWPGEEKIEQDVYLIYGTAHENQTQANIVYKPIKFKGTLPPLIDPTVPSTFLSLKSIANSNVYRNRMGSPRDITLKITYTDGEVLHLINPHHGYTRYDDYSWGYHIWRNDLMNFSIVVPGDKDIYKVELYKRPFLVGNSNYDKEGNINYYTYITSQNFMDEAIFQAEWVDDSILGLERKTFIDMVFPNPVESRLNVTLFDGINVKRVDFINLNGIKIKPNKINKTKNMLDIDVSNLDEGLYILEIVSQKDVNKVKVLIER